MYQLAYTRNGKVIISKTRIIFDVRSSYVGKNYILVPFEKVNVNLRCGLFVRIYMKVGGPIFYIVSSLRLALQALFIMKLCIGYLLQDTSIHLVLDILYICTFYYFYLVVI